MLDPWTMHGRTVSLLQRPAVIDLLKKCRSIYGFNWSCSTDRPMAAWRARRIHETLRELQDLGHVAELAAGTDWDTECGTHEIYWIFART